MKMPEILLFSLLGAALAGCCGLGSDLVQTAFCDPQDQNGACYDPVCDCSNDGSSSGSSNSGAGGSSGLPFNLAAVTGSYQGQFSARTSTGAFYTGTGSAVISANGTTTLSGTAQTTGSNPQSLAQALSGTTNATGVFSGTTTYSQSTTQSQTFQATGGLSIPATNQLQIQVTWAFVNLTTNVKTVVVDNWTLSQQSQPTLSPRDRVTP